MTHALGLVAPWVVAAIAAVVAFYIGRKWRKEYREAVANRNEYHELKASAAAAARVEVRQEASGNVVHVQVGSTSEGAPAVGAGVFSELRYQRRGSLAGPCARVAGALCDGADCGSDCWEALGRGPSNRELSQRVAIDRAAVARGLVPDALGYRAGFDPSCEPLYLGDSEDVN